MRSDQSVEIRIEDLRGPVRAVPALTIQVDRLNKYLLIGMDYMCR